MTDFLEGLKYAWSYMVEPPWRHRGNEDFRTYHWAIWLAGWSWALGGLILGALVAPQLAHFAGLTNTPYQDWLTIGVAVLAGFVVQLIGWCLALVWTRSPLDVEDTWLEWPITVLYILIPLSAIGYGIYRYLNWIGSDQRSVTIAFVGGLLIKTFSIPLIKGIVTGALFRWLMKWLHGGKDTEKAT